MESVRVDQTVTTIIQCPAGRLKKPFSPLCLAFSFYSHVPAPQFPVANILRTFMCLEAGGLQPPYGLGDTSGGRLSML